MKKNIIALAVASAIAAPVAMADAPTVYGQMQLSIDSISYKDTNGDKVQAKSGSQVNSYNSRVGVKGSADLGNGLKAIYKAEFKVNPDSKESFENRNQYVGLSGGFGTVLLGRHDTPYKMAQPKDLFNDARGDNKPMTGGLGILGNGGENRVSNALAYVSPSFGGVKLVGALVPKENSGDTTKESSMTDWVSVAAMYGSKKKGLYLTAAMDSANKALIGDGAGGSAAGDATQYRLAAQYAVAGLIANAMYQDVSGDGAKKEGSNIMLNVGYKMGNLMPKIKYSMNDYKDNAIKDSTGLGLGVDYALAKKTKVYAEYVSYDKTTYDRKNIGGKASDSAISVGLFHKF
uniref:Outer membrane porin n=1 Tax=Hydrogenovibrio crunogenus (strain DSM 25203 / XCL-2) TaxID=317025 RepID=Q31IG3_HYDCU